MNADPGLADRLNSLYIMGGNYQVSISSNSNYSLLELDNFTSWEAIIRSLFHPICLLQLYLNQLCKFFTNLSGTYFWGVLKDCCDMDGNPFFMI